MAKIIKTLNTQQVNGLVWEGSDYRKAVDGDGLYVKVSQHRKSWVMRTDKSWVTIGNVKSMPLAAARMEIAKRKSGLIDENEEDHLPTFKKAAEDYIDSHENEWKSPKHHKQWRSTLKEFAYPVIGSTPVDLITAKDVIKILDTVGSRLETAKRVRGRIKQVVDATWIINRTGQPYSNPADPLVIGTLRPAITKKIKQKHHVAIAVDKAPGAFKELFAKRKQNVSYAALCFTILTAARSGEVVGGLWDEVDGDLWTIPAERMKVPKDHEVPLSKQAKELLELRGLIDEKEGLLFPAPNGGELSDASMRQSLKRSCGQELTVHGWRSTFKDWATEREYNTLAVEFCLAHVVGSDTEQAYRRTNMMEKRKEILQDWADFLMK